MNLFENFLVCFYIQISDHQLFNYKKYLIVLNYINPVNSKTNGRKIRYKTYCFAICFLTRLKVSAVMPRYEAIMLCGTRMDK